MLKNTFLHIPGVGSNTERKIWERNVFSWSDFPKSNGLEIPKKTTERISNYLLLSEIFQA